MSVICPKCKETYSIKTDLFLNKEQQLQCTSCGYTWYEQFSKKPINKEENVQNQLLIKSDRKLSNEQALKILKEEAEFDKKFKAFSSNKKGQKITNISDEIQENELFFKELLRDREFWFGFAISVIATCALYLIYIYEDTLTKQFPYLNNYLGPFIDFVDSARYWIDEHKKDFISFIRIRFL